MSKVFAYRATAAGIARRQQERGQPIAAIEAVEAERALVSLPEPCNVVRLVIPRTEAQQIIADIAHKHGLTYADLIGRERWRHFVAARHDAVAAVKTAKPMISLTQLGKLFHRDHASIYHALQRRGMA